jgi:hypothetical protein
MAKRSEQGKLPFEYTADDTSDSVTAYGGLPLVVETMRALGVSDSVKKHLAIAKNRREHDEVAMVESFVALMAAGGDCLDDMTVLTEDEALARLMNRRFPSPETARRFLYAFHDDAKIAAAAKAAGSVAFIPEETDALKALARVNRDLVHALAKRRPPTRATIDADATIHESNKREAKHHYEGGRGYQPMVATWAEQDVVVADQFRDGNVGAAAEVPAFVQQAFAALPESVTDRRFRGDTAYYNLELLHWFTREGIQFTVGTRMAPDLRTRIMRFPENRWLKFQQRVDDQVDLLDNVPWFPPWPKDLPEPRFIALRIRPKQRDLIDEHTKYLVIATNRTEPAAELVQWHWQKAGTIEHVHDVVKNELGGGVLPCGRFGANAAWVRLALLTYNVLSAMKTIALPPDLHDARPKRLRFQVLVIPAVVVNHARKLWARLSSRFSRGQRLSAARASLWSSPTAA